MNELVRVFENAEFGNVRVMVEDGKELFVANDIAKALGYSNPSKATNDHCKCSIMKWGNDSLGRKQEFKMIPESDVFRLIVKSKLPSAELFEKWLFEEVLPSIRKNGGYIHTNEDDSDEDIMAKALLIAHKTIDKKNERIKSLELKVETDKPKVDFAERITSSESTFTTTQIAKELMMSAKQLNLILSNEGVQFKQNGQWLLYSKYQNKNYTKVKTTDYEDSHGNIQTKHYTVWTELGRMFILDLIDDI